VSARSVLVTGAAGFVGRSLARGLRERGHEVAGCGLEPALPEGLSVRAWFVADVEKPESLAAAVRGARPDWVVHLAGQASAGRSFEAPEETFRVNALGTWHLLEAVRAEAPRARVLVVGSGEAYGPQPAGSRVTEDAPFQPVSPYALSKAAADALARAHAARYDLDVVRTRSFSHTGPGQAPRFVIPSWAQQIAAIESGAGEPVLRVGNIEVTRDISHVDDVVGAYVALLERGEAGAAYNVCSGQAVTLTDVAARLTAMARTRIRVEVDRDRVRPADVPYLVGDPSKLVADTGWAAERTLDQALAAVLERWRSEVGGGR
jgi:GDP-4-dehydro-6-deoxy-D-mannose reductase